MTRNTKLLLNCSLFALMPLMANAAGTYYNRSYTNPNPAAYNNYNYANPGAGQMQQNPANGSRYSGYYPGMGTRNGYNNNDGMNQNNRANGRGNKNTGGKQVQSQGGFSADVGLSHQFANWHFDMKQAGSALKYNDLDWNVLDAAIRYDFNVGNTMLRAEVGGQYGAQYGDSSMIDDDITNGGLKQQYWDVDDDGYADWVENVYALSVGKTKGGDLYGVYAGIGLTDFWRIGNFRLTPSVGYRYFKYKLETKGNNGMSFDTVNAYCLGENGETQCLPFISFLQSGGESVGDMVWLDTDGDESTAEMIAISVPGGSTFVDTHDSFYFSQSGVSHSYETEWAGPYLAMDMVYDISKTDALNARLELGLPMYKATADQPYRRDWQHPKSVEDKGGFGDAYHFGMGANWLHSLSDSVMLTLGMTFDYYSVSGADATTYSNAAYYTGIYDSVDADKQAAIDALAAAGWQEKLSGEIDSVYKSMGLRLGIQAKF